jgi:LysR family cyn operon transcriptional activator
MELEQLRQLDAIERYGTMSAAAEQLHISQPSLSKSIKRLEADLGQELFDRTPNRVTFNDAGRLALDHAHAILAQVHLMRDDFDALAKRQRSLRVATVAPAPSWRLSALAIERFPGVILDPDIMTEQAVESALLNQETDLAITLRSLQLPNVRSVPLMTEDLFLYVRRDHPLAARSKVSFSEMNGETFLVFEQIGFWMDMCRAEMPDSQFIVQKDRMVFMQVLESTKLCAFTSDAPENATEQDDRVRVPIIDGAAHATFFACVRDDASEQAQQIVAWVAEGRERDLR